MWVNAPLSGTHVWSLGWRESKWLIMASIVRAEDWESEWRSSISCCSRLATYARGGVVCSSKIRWLISLSCETDNERKLEWALLMRQSESLCPWRWEWVHVGTCWSMIKAERVFCGNNGWRNCLGDDDYYICSLSCNMNEEWRAPVEEDSSSWRRLSSACSG